ncbi:MAG: glycosyltransferase [Elusimicrobia bacterium]|nr:glycosyltransferase [Elusimicrobiota bacterium]
MINKTNILHVTYDYPTGLTPYKTRNIEKLCESTDRIFNNTILSLNRTLSLRKKMLVHDKIIAFDNFSLPFSILFKNYLRRTVNEIKELNDMHKVELKNIRVIHAHKMSYEGAIAYEISREYGIPYVITMRQSDIKMWKYRPDLRGYYGRILKNAEMIYLVSPWMRKRVLEWYGKKINNIDGKILLLGSIVDIVKYRNNGQGVRRAYGDQKKFLSVFKIKKNYMKIKNVRRLLSAVKMARERNPGICLDITGEGNAVDDVKNMIKKYRLEAAVDVKVYDNRNRMNNYAGDYECFIMPSYPETFGVAYVEALVSGLPIIYSKNTGIDGYFGDDIGVKVDPFSVGNIADAVLRLSRESAQYKENVREFLGKNSLDIFSEEKVAGKYIESIEYILGAGR